ncbi:hypothetical protein M5689_012292 [Euphorbia peplus]|nr:hypothetical protein M5689_012292 [Euphorbia peplus]
MSLNSSSSSSSILFAGDTAIYSSSCILAGDTVISSSCFFFAGDTSISSFSILSAGDISLFVGIEISLFQSSLSSAMVVQVKIDGFWLRKKMVYSINTCTMDLFIL